MSVYIVKGVYILLLLIYYYILRTGKPIFRCIQDTTSAGFLFTNVVCICYKQLYEDEVSEAGPESWFYMKDDYTLITTLTSKLLNLSPVNCHIISVFFFSKKRKRYHYLKK